MPLVINTNVSSLNAQRNLTTNTNKLGRSIERLSSGFRINRAADDAAGLQLSENLRTQIRGSKKALDNTQDGINLLNIADGVFATVTDSLQRMRELAVQAANDTYDGNQRAALQVEYAQLSTDITRMFAAVEFNNVSLFNGSLATFNLQVGPNNTANDTINLVAEGIPFDQTLSAVNLGAAGTNLTGETIGTNSTLAIQALGVIDTSITTINTTRGTIGAVVNRLEKAAENLSISIENLSASESRVRNVDVAAESAELVQNQILQQAAASVLSQANQFPSLALSLLQG
ncbi:MAG: flagellin [Vampirovibrio sp.]|nr:flagellin [Vampirovibrio sp.]